MFGQRFGTPTDEEVEPITHHTPRFRSHVNESKKLVEESFTRCGTTKARNTICTPDLTLKFVIVGKFLI